jgi:hypothetical protein
MLEPWGEFPGKIERLAEPLITDFHVIRGPAISSVGAIT